MGFSRSCALFWNGATLPVSRPATDRVAQNSLQLGKAHVTVGMVVLPPEGSANPGVVDGTLPGAAPGHQLSRNFL